MPGRLRKIFQPEGLTEIRWHGYWRVSQNELHQVVKNNTNTHPSITTQSTSLAKSIKLGIDVHADSYRVVRQVDHATPQPAQKFSPKEFLLWAKKQLAQAQSVHSLSLIDI